MRVTVDSIEQDQVRCEAESGEKMVFQISQFPKRPIEGEIYSWDNDILEPDMIEQEETQKRISSLWDKLKNRTKTKE